MTRVLIAAADAALRSALKLALCQRLPIVVIGELGEQAELPAALASLQPDLLLLDWALPEFRAIDRLAGYQLLVPDLRMVAVGVPGEEMAAVLAGGAHACLAHGASPGALLGMLRSYVT